MRRGRKESRDMSSAILKRDVQVGRRGIGHRSVCTSIENVWNRIRGYSDLASLRKGWIRFAGTYSADGVDEL